MLGPARSLTLRALVIGIAAGLRSQTPGALLARHQPDAPRYARWRSWPLLRNRWGRRVLMLAGLGEVIGDKSPAAPPRIQPGPLAGRSLFGAIAGAALGSEYRGRGAIVRGAIFGAVGGVIGSFGGYQARKTAVEATGLPDSAVAVVEDVAVVSIANRMITKR